MAVFWGGIVTPFSPTAGVVVFFVVWIGMHVARPVPRCPVCGKRVGYGCPGCGR